VIPSNTENMLVCRKSSNNFNYNNHDKNSFAYTGTWCGGKCPTMKVTILMDTINQTINQ